MAIRNVRNLRLTGCAAALGVLLFSAGPPAAAQGGSSLDMIMSVRSGACVTAIGDEPDGATIGTAACRGSAAQYWRIDQDGYWHSGLDDQYCIAHVSGTSSQLTLALCSDERALQTERRTDVDVGYVMQGTTRAFDVVGSGEIMLYGAHTGTNQQFRWLQPTLDYLADHSAHEVSYPLAADDTFSYELELQRDQIARIQPPFEVPDSARVAAVFPGPVGQAVEWVTRDLTFDLNFRDHGYLRMAAPPQNWVSTGLYAPPGQIITVTVSGATLPSWAMSRFNSDRRPTRSIRAAVTLCRGTSSCARRQLRRQSSLRREKT
jgi:hypothetical protein